MCFWMTLVHVRLITCAYFCIFLQSFAFFPRGAIVKCRQAFSSRVKPSSCLVCLILFGSVWYFGHCSWPAPLQVRLQRRNKRRAHPRVYYKRLVRADGKRAWQGCKDLPKSAAYPAYFCQMVFKCWVLQMKSDGIHLPYGA